MQITERAAHCSKPASMRRSKHGLLALSLVACVGIFASSAIAQDVSTVSSCPGQSKLPVSFQIDCSHVKDAATRQLCRPFIENQACKVFPAYRKITGINLEDTCTQIKFMIYDDDSWPHPKGEAGGMAGHCSVDYLAKYSVNTRTNPKMGPYDVHEILHEYHLALGPLPDAHVLFASSMEEAIREIGDEQRYQQDIQRMRSEAKRLHDELESGKYKGDPRECSLAQTQVDEALYLENPRAVFAFYRKLPPAKGNSMPERNARFSRMYYIVSSDNPETKRFLTDHGCGPF